MTSTRGLLSTKNLFGRIPKIKEQQTVKKLLVSAMLAYFVVTMLATFYSFCEIKNCYSPVINFKRLEYEYAPLTKCILWHDTNTYSIRSSQLMVFEFNLFQCWISYLKNVSLLLLLLLSFFCPLVYQSWSKLSPSLVHIAGQITKRSVTVPSFHIAVGVVFIKTHMRPCYPSDNFPPLFYLG